MDNKEIYKKTLGFSLRRLLWDVLGLVLLMGLATVGYIIADRSAQNGPIGLLIGLLVGLVGMALIARFISYSLKAGQIAMMTRGITEGELPDNTIEEGKQVVKQRFVTVAAFFAITGAIKGIFNQLGRAIANIGQNLGGDSGRTVGSAISAVIQTVINYLCDCCLGWVFYRKEVKPARAACEGAVLFFKHGKTFFKNMGRVFGMGLASLLLIGGLFTGIFYLIISGQQEFYTNLAAQISANISDNTSAFARLLQDPKTLPIVFAAIGGVIVWSILHSVFIKPYVLTGVLRNYITSGMNEIPSEASFAALDSKSAKFRKLHQEI